MRVVHVRGRHFNGRQPSNQNFDCGMSLLLRGGGVGWDKNTLARLCTKNAWGLMRKGGGGGAAYLRDTTI